ncbi:hypothetical protein G6F57_021647 [Rhizopus arrhizus]|nr:hypothetical protein G6F57_021647 [Rhizopus arrhizus]
MAEGFNMLDPIKATVITPGLDMSGSFGETGSPAALVAKYLTEHGVVVEKTGLYSFFILFTIGITKGRWNTLLTALQQSIAATSAWACAISAKRSTKPTARATSPA